MTKPKPVSQAIYTAAEVCELLKIPRSTLLGIHKFQEVGRKTSATIMFTSAEVEWIKDHRAKHPKRGRIKE